jgi:hypothetical protein
VDARFTDSTGTVEIRKRGSSWRLRASAPNSPAEGQHSEAASRLRFWLELGQSGRRQNSLDLDTLTKRTAAALATLGTSGVGAASHVRAARLLTIASRALERVLSAGAGTPPQPAISDSPLAWARIATWFAHGTLRTANAREDQLHDLDANLWDLTLLEARITGRIPATEIIMLVRDTL